MREYRALEEATEGPRLEHGSSEEVLRALAAGPPRREIILSAPIRAKQWDAWWCGRRQVDLCTPLAHLLRQTFACYFYFFSVCIA